MIYLVREPEGDLSQYVAQMVYYQDYVAEHRIERFLPDGTTNLVIDLCDEAKFIYDNKSLKPIQSCRQSWFSGMMSQYLSIDSGTDSKMLVVSFKPAGAYVILGQPLYAFIDKVVPASEVFGESINSLRTQLIGKEETDPKFQVLQAWLQDLIQPRSFSFDVVRNTMAKLIEAPLTSVEELASKAGYSQKQFIHLYKTFVGVTPKLHQRILRFNDILALTHKKRRIDWAACASECGYHDQAHFIRDFQRFSGLNPNHYLQDQGEWANYIPIK